MCISALCGRFSFLPLHSHRSFSLWLQPTEYVQVCGLLTQTHRSILRAYPSVYQEQDNFNPKNEHQWNAKGDRKRVKEKNNWLAVWFTQMESVCVFFSSWFLFFLFKTFSCQKQMFSLRVVFFFLRNSHNAITSTYPFLANVIWKTHYDH